ncbi:unnamed protein product [Rhodiola kirilowii]
MAKKHNRNQSQSQYDIQSHQNPRRSDYALKETKPLLGGGRIAPGDRLSTTFDLVEQMHHIYVRIVRARNVQEKSSPVSPYIEVKIGSIVGVTKHVENSSNPEWNQVFAFSKEKIQCPVVEVIVKNKDAGEDGGGGGDNFLGQIVFELSEVPKRVPPDSPLAPEWYRLEDKSRDSKVNGEVMLAVWLGTQADEVFADAWHSCAATVADTNLVNVRSKVYLSPRLWYLRVNVIEAQDLSPVDKNRMPEAHVKVIVGHSIVRTKTAQARTRNPMWNEDLMFVVAEPFDEQFIVYVVDKLNPGKEEAIGECMISLQSVERRLGPSAVANKWYSLEKRVTVKKEDQEKKEDKFAGKVHLRICLEGGYHVLDESAYYSSDFKPTAKQLWKPSIGMLELGILNAQGLVPTKKNRHGREVINAFCIAKYGQKWVRTRTIVDSSAPVWNEQYTWEVFDPCTVITIGVFDNGHLVDSDNAKDTSIGKVRIRLSSLQSGKIYTHYYPLLVLEKTGLKKMGEIQLAVRFNALSVSSLMGMYAQPLLPVMHYVLPLSIFQQDSLRHQAIQTVSARLSRSEPPLSKEVIGYMLDLGSHLWSMRKSKANFNRIVTMAAGFFAAYNWFKEICNWKTPYMTVLVFLLYVLLILLPHILMPVFFLFCMFTGLWKYRLRPRNPPHMDTKLSFADNAAEDESDEEFDSYPTTRNLNTVKLRYDRLRSIAGRLQELLGDLASQGERVHALLSWRDPRATFLFLVFCLVAAVFLFIVPPKVVAILIGGYAFRHPKLRSQVPSAPLNFFRRLPSKTESML